MISACNDITDRDATWSPFLYLRPEKAETISLSHLTKIAVYFGLSYGGVYFVLSLMLKEDPKLLHLLLFPILAVPLYGGVFGIFFMIPWNIRAKRLQAQKSELSPSRREGL